MSQSFGGHTISLVVRLWVGPMRRQGGPRWRGRSSTWAAGRRRTFECPPRCWSFLPLICRLPPLRNQTVRGCLGNDGSIPGDVMILQRMVSR